MLNFQICISFAALFLSFKSPRITMSAPVKPWEVAGVNSRAATPVRGSLTPRPSVPYGSRPNALNPSISNGTGSCDGGQGTSRNPPPLPSRPQRSSIASAGGIYGGYGSYGSAFGTGMYGTSYGGLYGSSYGGYGSMYGGGGYGGYGSYNRIGSYGPQPLSSPFVRRAEESSQAAFQSVESIVQAFGSISMMLESTHFAMLNTFRAVLGAADHFSRLKSHMLNAIGAIAILKTIKTLCKKLLYILGLIRSTGVENEVWSEAHSSVSAAASAEGKDGKSTRSWPIVMFFAVVLGVPWVIWKLLRSLIPDEDDSRDWMTGTGDHVLARVEYDFAGEAEDELSITAGSIIKMAPKDKQPRIRGWLLATVDGEREGIVPANYVKILGLQRGSKSKSEGTSTLVSSTISPSIPSTSNPTTTTNNSNIELGNAFTQSSNVPAATQNTNSFEQSYNNVNMEMPDESEMDRIINGQT